MLHGNPSWSFYWRHLVNGLKDRYRCIVPDHVGMGLSDRPDDARRHRRATTTPCSRGSTTSMRCCDISASTAR
jgi:pimeloyl-ACP methyl ester carboxylesterase